MTERRFTDAEVAAIFEQATEAQQSGRRPAATGEGMTLAELRDIGREVGISPDLIDHAAQVVTLGPRPPARTLLGMPLGVERTVELGRKLSDDEWERFVVDLRETFDARGTLRHEGSLRSWTNGNLQALLEPTANGHRIRLRTMKGDAVVSMFLGGGMVTAAATMFSAAALKGALNDGGFIAAVGFLALMGAGMLGSTVLRLPGWARTRRQQMEDLAARAGLLATPRSSDDSGDKD